MSLPLLYNYDLDDQCYRLRLTASVCGVEIALHNMDVFPGHDDRTPAYLARNPLARLPALEHEGVILRQAAAIQTYLSDLPGARPLQPADAVTRAGMLDWMVFADRDLATASAARSVALLGAPGDGPALTARSRDLLRMMDDHMTRQTLLDCAFFAGNALSLADLAVFPAFALSRDFGIGHEEFPALRLWARRIRQVTGFITMPGIPDYH